VIQNNANRFGTLISILAVTSLGLGSCATAIHKTDSFDARDGAQALSIDAKQRVVIFKQLKDPTSSANGATITCAEPSPDALSALSTSLGGSLKANANVVASLAAASTESAASIGLRTQSIQLLRDGMYRLCEAYAAQAINAEEFNRQQRRYQNLMLSLLAIEQITGAVVPRQVGLGNGASSAAVGDNANEAAATVTAADKAVSDAQTAVTAATKKLDQDKAACRAAGSDPTNASCFAVDKDTDDVNAKTATLKTAQAQQTTAKGALDAARAAVNAKATGATISFGDTNKTLQLTDASARYVSEAARTIVSTTLLASFAQEECSRLWDLVADESGAYSSSGASFQGTSQSPNTSNTPAVATPPNSATKDSGSTNTTTPIPAKSFAERLGFFTGEPQDQVADRIKQLFSNCQTSQDALLHQAAMFTPQYGDQVSPLTVLGATTVITIAPGDPPHDLRIVGGLPPYQIIIEQTFSPGKEIEATTPAAKGLTQTLHITRPAGASQEGPVTIIVVDANNAHYDVQIALAKKASSPAGSPAAELSAPTNIAATSSDGEITVSFTPPKASNIAGYTANATNNSGAKGTPVLSAPGTSKSKSVVIPGCTAGDNYTVLVKVKNTAGNTATSKEASVKCNGAAPVAPNPAASKIAAPTKIAVKSAGSKLVVSFAAPNDPASEITGYTASATNTGNSKDQLNGKSRGKEALVIIPGCTVGDFYTVTATAVAKEASSNSIPSEKSPSLKCVK
jgi:hypothetical protein